MLELSAAMRQKFAQYPNNVEHALLNLRQIILQVAAREAVQELTETLKWGQLSYRGKKSSSIRIDWSDKDPDNYRLYFICNTLLIETFRELYPSSFTYEGNRCIVLKLDQEPPLAPLKHCLSLALNYHSVKHLPLLGG